MNEEFISYEQALELKQLGFDEPCFGFYDESLYFPNNENQYGTFCNQKLDAPSCSAPLYQQAFRWFREKGYRYTISSDCFEKNGMFYFEAWKHKQFTFDSGLVYSTYEEAELACLKKLIEIVNGGDK